MSEVIEDSDVGVGGPEDGHVEEVIKVDRKKLEELMRADLVNAKTASTTPVACQTACERFFHKIETSTNTKISWPMKLKIGAKSKKDPHVRVSGLPEDVNKAKELISSVLTTKSSRVTLKMDVSHTDHSHIIGKGGLSIKQVMLDTQCHIHFPDYVSRYGGHAATAAAAGQPAMRNVFRQQQQQHATSGATMMTTSNNVLLQRKPGLHKLMPQSSLSSSSSSQQEHAKHSEQTEQQDENHSQQQEQTREQVHGQSEHPLSQQELVAKCEHSSNGCVTSGAAVPVVGRGNAMALLDRLERGQLFVGCRSEEVNPSVSKPDGDGNKSWSMAPGDYPARRRKTNAVAMDFSCSNYIDDIRIPSGSSGCGSIDVGGCDVGSQGISDFLTTIGLEKYTTIFTQQEVDLDTLLTLTDTELQEIGVATLGARKKIRLAASTCSSRSSSNTNHTNDTTIHDKKSQHKDTVCVEEV